MRFLVKKKKLFKIHNNSLKKLFHNLLRSVVTLKIINPLVLIHDISLSQRASLGKTF